MPVSFTPSIPPHQPLQYPSTYPPPSVPHDIAIKIPDDDSFQCAVELPGPEVAPPVEGLLAAIRTAGFMQAMTDRIAPHMEPGSAARIAVDKTGLFNVNQLALEIPMHLWGLSGKYGVQVNIVKPDIFPVADRLPRTEYYLQLFPAHDEIGFNLPQTLSYLLPKDCLPEWCGLSAQIIRNHGLNIPIIHTDAGWKLGGFGDEYTIDLLLEWVIRPAELDLKYLGTPLQATIGLELGMHFKWKINNPKATLAFAASTVGNTIGMVAGIAAAGAGGGNPMLLMHAGAMLGQLSVHGLQCWSNVLCPDEVVTWAGATFSAADLNQAAPPGGLGRLTNYPRIWGHAHDGCWRPEEIRQQAEAAIARCERDHAIDMAEMGIAINCPPQHPPRSISEQYASQL